MSLFDKVGKFEALVSKLPRKTAIPASVQKTLNVAAKFDKKLEKLAQMPEPLNPPGPMAGGGAEREQAAPAQKLPAIPANVQNALSSLMVKLNIGIPLRKADGIRGPDTEQAIAAYKKNMPSAANLEGKRLYDKIMSDWKRSVELERAGKQGKDLLAALQQGAAGVGASQQDQAFEQGMAQQKLRPPVQPGAAPAQPNQQQKDLEFEQSMAKQKLRPPV